MPLLFLAGEASSATKTFTVPFTRMGLGGHSAFPLVGALFANKEQAVVTPEVPEVAEKLDLTGGGVRPERKHKPLYFIKPLSFEGLSLKAREEPVEIEESSEGMQIEINRFQSVVDSLQTQLESIDQEIDLYKEKADLVHAKLLEEEAERARIYVAELLLQILQLRGIRRRRLEEEELLFILMIDEWSPTGDKS